MSDLVILCIHPNHYVLRLYEDNVYVKTLAVLQPPHSIAFLPSHLLERVVFKIPKQQNELTQKWNELMETVKALYIQRPSTAPIAIMPTMEGVKCTHIPEHVR